MSPGLDRDTVCTKGGHYIRGSVSTKPPYNLADSGSAHSMSTSGESFELCQRQDLSYSEAFAAPVSDIRFGWQDWTYVVPGEEECSGPTSSVSWCEAFANRSVLFVGDSLMEHQVISLLALLAHADGTRPGAKALKSILNLNTKGEPRQVCNGFGQVGFVRNDFVCERSWGGRMCSPNGAGASNRQPFTAIAERHYDSLVLNAGLHMMHMGHIDPTFTLSHCEHLALWLNTTRHTVVWRTGLPGHVGCANASEPLREAYAPPVAYHAHDRAVINASSAAARAVVADVHAGDVYGWSHVLEPTLS